MSKHQFNSETAKAAAAKASPRGENKIKKWIREAADKQSAIEVFSKLTEKAKNGDMEAIKTYLSYVVGKPGETIKFIGDEESPIIFKMDERFFKQLINGG